MEKEEQEANELDENGETETRSRCKCCCLSCLAIFLFSIASLVIVTLSIMGSEMSSISPEHMNALEWPVQDDLGFYQAYKHNGRWVNWWSRKKPSALTILTKFVTAPDRSNIPSSTEELDRILPVNATYWVEYPGDPVGLPGVRATWLGHASVLAEVDTTVVLTDPIFSERASAVQWAGPKRYRPPACTVAELPKELKAVVISHSHYDHLDYNSVLDLHTRYGSDLHWFVPMDMAKWFTDNFAISAANVHELKWWEEKKIPGTDTKVVCTPSNHWGKRTAFDDNKMLWGSWSILGPKHKFFFGGDTGYCEGFKQIGKKLGPFDLAAIPIGAYEPRETMVHHHVNPEEAFKIHKDIQSKLSFGIHWATFKLTHEPIMDPKIQIEAISKDHGDDDKFKVIGLGETINIS